MTAPRFRNAAAICLMGVVAFATASPQGGSRRATGFVLQGVMQHWDFADTLPLDSLRITGVTQISIPVAAIGVASPSWAFELAAAYALGAVHLGDGSELPLDGFTDVRVRLQGPIIRERLQLTLGYNGPTGLTKLSEAQVAALRVLGAPALRLAIPVLGVGPGGTAGLVLAQNIAGWSFALGAAYEYRGRYAPIEALIAGQASVTNLDPAEALHYSVGVDKIVGAHRVAFLGTMDSYNVDRLSARANPGAPDEVFSTYQLGPNYRLLGQFDVAAPRFREFTITAQWRKRTPYSDETGAAVEGSDGSVFEAQLSTVFGSPRGFGLIAQLDMRNDSGLDVEDTFITAAMRARGATIGLSIPLGAVFLEAFARREQGTIDLGRYATAARGVTYGVRLAPR